MRKTLSFLATICVVVLTMAPTAVERNFLTISGIQGDATDAAHREWFQVESFNWGTPGAVTNTIGGRAGNQCSVHEVIATREVTQKGRKLSSFCSTGKHIPAITIELNGQRHLLQDVVVKSAQSVRMADGSVREVMTLDFARCATHESAVPGESTDVKHKGEFTAGFKKYDAPNAILIGLTPRPVAAGIIGVLVNGDGRTATITRAAVTGAEDGFRSALRSRQTIPSLTITLNDGRKWTFTNVTIGGITDGTSNNRAGEQPTESLSLNFTKVEYK